ncbi:MAG: electron transport complex subunit RsxE, partial [Aminobacterium sp.]|nr:electron transport complex subunit RsxE [Aminobacterium sp.]
GLAATVVLMGSNVVISALKRLIPDEIRIPAFIIIIATFVTLIKFFMQAFLPALNKALGIFIPLIVVNCIILGRAEAYASKNSVLPSLFDAIGMGLGFTLALVVLGSIRELLGTGTVFGMSLLPATYNPALIMILAPGGFLTLGMLMALINFINMKRKKENERISRYADA